MEYGWASPHACQSSAAIRLVTPRYTTLHHATSRVLSMPARSASLRAAYVESVRRLHTNLVPSLSGGAIDLADYRYGIFALSLHGAVDSQLQEGHRRPHTPARTTAFFTRDIGSWEQRLECPPSKPADSNLHEAISLTT